MSAAIQEGSYRAEITEYGLLEVESGAVGVTLTARLLERWVQGDEGGWENVEERAWEAQGVIWIVKKDGSANNAASESLINHLAWDGSLLTVESGQWRTPKCQVTLKWNEWKGEKKLQIAFVNSYLRKPGGNGNVTRERAVELEQKYASQFSSMVGDREPAVMQPPPPDKDIPF